MLDVVMISLIFVVPALLFSIFQVKVRRNYGLHKKLQVILCLAVFAVVALFEVDMQMQGGFWVMAKDSPYVDTAFLKNLLIVHLFFSISTTFLWIITFVTAMWLFPSPVGPGSFSGKHKVLAWLSVVDMVATVVTGLMVYYYGFWLAR